jgi:hypothetical protein
MFIGEDEIWAVVFDPRPGSHRGGVVIGNSGAPLHGPDGFLCFFQTREAAEAKLDKILHGNGSEAAADFKHCWRVAKVLTLVVEGPPPVPVAPQPFTILKDGL